MSYREEYWRWLDSPALTDEEWQELSAIKGDDGEIKSRFFAPLQFGTAGLRGVMGMGPNRMNIHVVRQATQAFANVINRAGATLAAAGVVICYDCRENSELFAKEAARVMAGNGVHVRLFDALRPTPELSFAIRRFGAAAGINITASHNPREYNGYKVYWSDGAQLPPDRAEAIADEMKRVDIFTGARSVKLSKAEAEGLFEYIGAAVDEEFLAAALSQAIDPEAVKRAGEDFSIVYTPFHGAGYRLVPEALRRLGVKKLFPVSEQMVIDGAFPTVASPNPENPEGFYLAVELAKKENCGLIIGTDPDSDRVGVMVRDKSGEYVHMSGNRIGVLLLDYIITARREKGTLPENAAAIKTIVTTEMARAVAQKNGVFMAETFTGFKFMAEKIAEFEREGSHKYIFAYEESYGYMTGDFVRDKDAVTASVLITEMAAHYHARGMTLLDAMEELYEKYGFFMENTLSLVMPGVDGLEKMAQLMSSLRKNPPEDMNGEAVLRMRDYLDGRISVFGLGNVGETEISGSNVLYFELDDGSSLIVRPSGTEPKIKIYILVRGSTRDECQDRLDRLTEYAATLGK